MEDIPELMRDCFHGNHPGKISSNGGHSVLYTVPKHLELYFCCWQKFGMVPFH